MSAKEAIKVFAYGKGKDQDKGNNKGKDKPDPTTSGIALVSARQDISMEALQKSVNFLARLNITVQGKVVTLEAGKSLTINGGGSQTVWSAAGIQTQTAGSHTAYASSHATPKGKSTPTNVPVTQVADSPLQSLRFAPIGANALLKDAGHERSPFTLHDARGQAVASGSVANAQIPTRLPQDDQSHLTLTIGKNDIELMESTAAASTPAPQAVADALEAMPPAPDPETAEWEQRELAQSPFYQATIATATANPTLHSAQLQGLFKLQTHQTSEEVRSAHHE